MEAPQKNWDQTLLPLVYTTVQLDKTLYVNDAHQERHISIASYTPKMHLANKYIRRSTSSAANSAGSNTSKRARTTLSTALPTDPDSLLSSASWLEVKVQVAYCLGTIAIKKGTNTATFSSDEKKAKQLLLLITVSGCVTSP